MVKRCIYPDVIDSLESLNVCQRCILRFLGIKSYDSYATRLGVQEVILRLRNTLENMESNSESLKLNIKPELCNDATHLNEDCSTVPSSKRHSPTPCPACLGILQDSCDKMAEKIERAVKESGHQFRDFVLQLSMPVTVDLRQHLFLLFLEEKFGDVYADDKNDIASVKDVWKWVIGPQFGKSSKTDFTPDSEFQISISITHPDAVNECLKLFEKCPEAFPNRMKKKAKQEDIYTRTAVLKAMDFLSVSLKELYSLPPLPTDRHCEYGDIHCFHCPLYVGGRYNKYSRQLSQTPWFVDGKRRIDSSVNELITDIVKKWIVGDKIVFSASGREDVDVKMLGNGRPFVLEVLNPRQVTFSLEKMKDIENEINNSTSDIAIRDFQVITKKDILLLKEGEEKKKKTYLAHCLVEKILCKDDINKLLVIKDLILQQKTPVRVLHRRTLATREKLVHNIEPEILTDHELRLKIETQAGTYVKEFVHGDFGRTSPNLGTLLGTRADILELDVESIHLDWPPSLES